MRYEELKSTLAEYNWDDGFDVPMKLLNDLNCDLALALEIFYLADGYAYLDNPVANPKLEKWSLFISDLYNDILNGKYVVTEFVFEIPLSKVEKYKFRKKQVPEVFLTDL